MTCVWCHIKPYNILYPKIHETPKVKFSTLQPLICCLYRVGLPRNTMAAGVILTHQFLQ